MILTFNSIPFRVVSCGLRISAQSLLDSAQEPYATEETWDITHRVKNTGTTAKDMDPLVAAIQSRFNQQATSISLNHTDGTPTVHSVTASDTIGGLRVTMPPSFPEPGAGQHIAFRTVTFQVKFIRRKASNGYVLKWEESLDVQEGGAEYAILQPNVGPAVKQLVRTNLAWFATQSGTVSVLGPNPPLIPAAKWPNDMLAPVKRSVNSPKRIGRGQNTDYMNTDLTYSYTFGSPSPLPNSYQASRWTQP